MNGGNKRKTSRRNRSGRMPFSARLGLLITVLVLAVVAAGALMAPGLNITEVYCEGNVNLKAEDIITAAQLSPGSNIFLTHIGKGERNVEKLAMIKSADIKRVFPDKICISVEERTPIAYIQTGNELAVIDGEKIVVKTEKDAIAAKIVQENTPKTEEKTENVGEEKSADKKEQAVNEDKDKNDSEEEEDSSSDESKDTENTENAEKQGTDTDEEENQNLIKVPLVSGIDLSSAKEGKEAKCEDENKFNKVTDICGALQNSGLLQRTTYIDVTNLNDIKLIIENRLDVMIGSGDNINYRAKFMAEVINNKISAYETAVLEYTGDDIYVRPRDDGKQRVVEKKESKKSSENDKNNEDNEDDEETDSKKNSDDEESSEDDEDTQSKSKVASIDEEEL